MNATLMLGVVVGLSAPTLKDPPKSEPAIVGEWALESIAIGGVKSKPTDGTSYEFTADGLWISRRTESPIKAQPLHYKVDPKAKPATIDAAAPAARNAAPGHPMLGIYKVEGDTLTICYSASGEERPKAFESPRGATAVVMVCKRVKKKEKQQ